MMPPIHRLTPPGSMPTGDVSAPDDRRGSGLIVALWVVALLSLIVGSFAFDAHIEARLTSYYRKRLKADYLARSGLEMARMLMDKVPGVAGDTLEDEDDRWWSDARRLSEGQAVRGLTEPLGEGLITLDIVPEPARINVNLLKEEDWERILEVIGVPEEIWPDLVDPFFDWIDEDNRSRPGSGAESDDYYATLTPPYRAKNGPLDTVGELLLIKNFERAMLTGGALKNFGDPDNPVVVQGLEDILTVYGDGRVNVNAASDKVLRTLPGVDELVAGAIIEEREGWLDETGQQEDHSFKNVDDLMARIPDLDDRLRDRVSTDSQIFRVTSTGSVGGVDRQISCIVAYSRGTMTILRWREED